MRNPFLWNVVTFTNFVPLPIKINNTRASPRSLRLSYFRLAAFVSSVSLSLFLSVSVIACVFLTLTSFLSLYLASYHYLIYWLLSLFLPLVLSLTSCLSSCFSMCLSYILSPSFSLSLPLATFLILRIRFVFLQHRRILLSLSLYLNVWLTNTFPLNVLPLSLIDQPLSTLLHPLHFLSFNHGLLPLSLSF